MIVWIVCYCIYSDALIVITIVWGLFCVVCLFFVTLWFGLFWGLFLWLVVRVGELLFGCGVVSWVLLGGFCCGLFWWVFGCVCLLFVMMVL